MDIDSRSRLSAHSVLNRVSSRTDWTGFWKDSPSPYDPHDTKSHGDDIRIFSDGIWNRTYSHLNEKDKAMVSIFITHKFGRLSLDWKAFLDLARQLNAVPALLHFTLPLFKPNIDTSGGDLFVGEDRPQGGPMYRHLCVSIHQCRIKKVDEYSFNNVVVYYQRRGDVASHGFRSRWIFIAHDDLGNMLDTYETESAYSDPEVSGYAIILSVVLDRWPLLLDWIDTQLAEARRLASKEYTCPTLGSRIEPVCDITEKLLRRAQMRTRANNSILDRVISYYEHVDKFNRLRGEFENARYALARCETRAVYLLEEVERLRSQTSRGSVERHSTKLETFAWHNVKLNYALEAAVRQASLIVILFAPAIFTSTFFSSNFFIIDGRKFVTQNIWIWFVVTVPLTVVLLGLVSYGNYWRSQRLLRESFRNPSTTSSVPKVHKETMNASNV